MANLEDILRNLNKCLGDTVEQLAQLSPPLSEILHPDDELPNSERLNEANRAVDLLHRVQVSLDSPTLILADHFLGYVRSKCLLAAVERQVPDALEEGPLTLDELSTKTESRTDRLGQILRILCHNGIFKFDEETGRYSHSPASSLLLSKHWTQWQNWVTLYADQFYDIARGIPESVRLDSVRSAAQINYNTDSHMFEFFHKSGWVPQLHKTLGGGATAQMPGMLTDYPWDSIADELVLDIGGGFGAFLAGLLRRYPAMKGGIFDQSHVIEHVKPFFQSNGQYSDVGDRVLTENLISGDFFKSTPKNKIYTMKWCLHDWKDPEALLILRNLRNSIVPGPNSRLIVFESILSDEHSGRLSQYGDINMMMTANGNERTEKQYRELARHSGWTIDQIYDLRRAWVKAIDMRPTVLGRE